MKVHFFNIDWDTDGKKVDLPSEVLMEGIDPDTDLEEEGADLLSDQYGWCLFGCNYEIVE